MTPPHGTGFILAMPVRDRKEPMSIDRRILPCRRSIVLFHCSLRLPSRSI
jgi:hypothetical protein